jgi:hypothetical protein
MTSEAIAIYVVVLGWMFIAYIVASMFGGDE